MAHDREIVIDIVPVLEEDIPELSQVMTRAFDDDARKHLGVEKGGPAGYDDGEFFRKWLFSHDASVGYKITSAGRIVGAFILWLLEDGCNRLGTIFVDPDYQDQGVATRAWCFIERTYPDSQRWTLATPGWALKSHHFYEQKCGFTKVGEELSLEGVSFIYQKTMRTR